MAPEQAQGRPATPASVRYALAVIAWELFAGQPPFEAESALALMNQQLREQIHDRDPQAVDRMEEHTEEDEDLKQPVFVNRIEKTADLPTQERCQDMNRDKNRYAYTPMRCSTNVSTNFVHDTAMRSPS
jgi:serine/threonine protein kinase